MRGASRSCLVQESGSAGSYRGRKVRTRALGALLGSGLLAACSHVKPDTIVSPGLESGITSQNGGGARALGNQPGVGITTQVGPGSTYRPAR